MKSSHRHGSARALVAASLLVAASRVRAAEPPVREELAPAKEPSPSAPPVPPSSASTSLDTRPDQAPRAAEEVLLLRTAIVGAAESTASARPTSRDLLASTQAQKLDLLLSDAIQDLGLTLDLSERSTQETRELTDVELIARASKAGRWVVYPSLDARGSESVVRLAAVAPGTKTVIVRAEPIKPADLAVRTVVMLRDVVSRREPAMSEMAPARPQHREPRPTFAVPARSQGRATLAFNSALFGGFVGYSVQRGSGSDDPRLLFPLMALGTGLGLGASAIIAEEWDVGLGDAWYLSAGAWWPAMSGLFLARSRRQVDPSTEYGFAVVGALTGLGLTTASLAIGGGMSEGGALLTHSGGVFGLVLGGMTELAIRDNGFRETPHRGLGIGTAAGVLLAGAAATRLQVEPSRVLIIDLGAGLGGLAGAAAASPFIVRDRTEGGDRAFLLTTMGTTIAGGIAAWIWTRKSTPLPPAAALSLPRLGVAVIAESPPGFGPSRPVVGLDVSGPLP
ncbi:MAG TPA: hypothetical protein VK540_30300 [Polyangiaceae bacterium]|nr:hypothetical protein [Polyangiaceae bacterium]